MAERYYYNQNVRNASIRRKLDRRFISWVMICACFGAAVATGFVYSARCHFEAVALGYETQKQRVEIEQKTEQRRQLELNRTRALSPEELEQRARRIGMRNPEPPASASVNVSANVGAKAKADERTAQARTQRVRAVVR
jgi:hypothetical protein